MSLLSQNLFLVTDKEVGKKVLIHISEIIVYEKMSVSQSHTPIQTTVHATLISTAVAERERQTPIYQSPQKPRSGECRQDFCRRYDGRQRE